MSLASRARLETVSEARIHLKDLLDAAEAGVVGTVRREQHRTAVVDAERLREALAALITIDPQIVAEAGGFSAFIPGLPVSASGRTIDEAVDDLVLASREYAEDWNERLRLAPNHHANRSFVWLVDLSTDEELRDWFTT